MVVMEGKGMVAPHPIRSELQPHQFQVLAAEAQKRCDLRSDYQQHRAWKRGLVRRIDVPHVGELTGAIVPIFIGFVGEYAVVRYVNRSLGRDTCCVDFAARAYGDSGCDVEVGGAKLQVKTRVSSDYSSTLVRVRNDRGVDCRPSCHAFAFCRWVSGNTYVDLLGWARASSIFELPEKPARAGHVNVSVSDALLEPACSLADALVAWGFLCR